MNSPAIKVKAPPPEPVSVTVKPAQNAGVGVYEVTVKIDDRKSGSSIVRTSPRDDAFQK